jgi:hypothetical protein
MALHRVIKISPESPGLVNYRLGPSKLYLDDIDLIYQELLKAAE